jgi:HK97 family phage major capsid protein
METETVYLRNAEQIMRRAQLEGRLLTAAEADDFDRNMRMHESTSERPSTRRSAPNPVGDDDDDGISTRYQGPQTKADRWGWGSFGSFCAAVRVAANPEGGASTEKNRERLLNAPTTYGNEAVGADGGFAIPPTWRAQILQKVGADESIISRCDQIPTSSNSLNVPKDEHAPWDTSKGIRAYWEGEASQMPQSKPALENDTVKTNKLTALVPVTDEQLEDAPSMGSYVLKKAPQVMNSKISDAIVRGNGAGMPLGILNSGALITVNKESSQAAATLLGLNVAKMFSRLYAGWISDAVWLVNQDVMPQLIALNIPVKNVAGTENVGGVPVFVAGNDINRRPYDTLLGRPIVYTQACSTLGTIGDVIFAALGQYMIPMRGLKANQSIHLWFDYSITAFRFVFRLGGQPWWSAPLSPKNGSTTISAFVALETRA